jgi:hypothetical protein
VSAVSELICAGSSRCLRSYHQAENLGDPDRFSHGSSRALVNTGRPNLARRQSIAQFGRPVHSKSGRYLIRFFQSSSVVLIVDICQDLVLRTRYCASSPTSTSFVMLYDASSSGLPVRVFNTCAQRPGLMFFCCRTSDLLQRERIPRRSCLGHACCAYMSAISQCRRRRDRQSVFYHHASMVRIKFVASRVSTHTI